jgi:hypothetical protein
MLILNQRLLRYAIQGDASAKPVFIAGGKMQIEFTTMHCKRIILGMLYD